MYSEDPIHAPADQPAAEVTGNLLRSPFFIGGLALLIGVTVGLAAAPLFHGKPELTPEEKKELVRGELERSGLRYNSSGQIVPTSENSGSLAGGNSSVLGDGSAATENVTLSPRDTFDQLLADLADEEKEVDFRELMGQLELLKAMGEPGIQVMADYLVTGENVDFSEMDGPFRRVPDMRAAILGALEGEDSPAALTANLDVLNNTETLSEAVLAARNLDGSWPEEYTGQITQMVNALVEKLPESEVPDQLAGREFYLAMNYVGHYDQPQLLGPMESMLKDMGSERWSSSMYVNSLAQMSPDAQGESLTRIANKDPDLAARVLSENRSFEDLNLSNPATISTSAKVFTESMNEGQQRDFLRQLEDAGDPMESWSVFGGRERRELTPEQAMEQINGALNIAEAIADSVPQEGGLAGQFDRTVKSLQEKYQKAQSGEVPTGGGGRRGG